MALIIHREIGSKQYEGSTLVNLAIMLFYQGQIKKAEEMFHQALAIQREVGDRRSEGLTLGWLATMARVIEGDFEKALELIESSERILEESGAIRELAERLCEHGHIQLALGKSSQNEIISAKQVLSFAFN